MASYYVSASGTGSTGTSTASAWNYATFNSKTLASGDIVYFKRGDTFRGTFKVTSGVTYDAYGTGADPVISGFTVVSGWSAATNGVRYVTLTATDVTSVLVNGAQQVKGRWPKTGYNTIEATNGSTTVTSTSLVGQPSYVGGEMVHKPNRYTLTKSTITAHDVTGGVLTIGTATAIPQGFGFFIQNSVKVLTQLGEWWYDKATKRFYMYFGAADPNTYTVEAATVGTLISAGSKTDVTFQNLAIEGSYQYGLYISSAVNLAIRACTIRYHGFIAIKGDYTSNFTLDGSSVSYNYGNALMFNTGASYTSVTNNTFLDNAMVPGMGGSGFLDFVAVNIKGNNTTFSKNTINGSGLSGIKCKGIDVLIEKSFITRWCWILDDSGGISMGNSTDMTTRYYNQYIDHNILIWTPGQSNQGIKGGTYLTSGIYMDDNTHGVTITNNTIAGCKYGQSDAGIYLHNNWNMVVKNNLSYDNVYALKMAHSSNAGKFTNMDIQNNTWAARSTSPLQKSVSLSDGEYLYSSWGTVNGNIYARPVSEGTRHIRVNVNGTTSDYFLAEWQGLYGYDLTGKITPSGLSTSVSDQVFEYNASDAPVTKSAPWFFKDMNGVQYSPSYTIPAWSSVFGVKMVSQPSSDVTPPVIPSGTIATSAVTASSVTLSWTKSAETSLLYTVYRSLSNGLSTIQNTIDTGTVIGSGTDIATLTATGLNPATQYYFNVIVQDASGNKTLYSGATATTTGDVTAPLAGVLQNPTSIGTTTLSLAWSAASDNITASSALVYKVYKSALANMTTPADAAANGTLIASGTAITSTNVTGLTAGSTTYFTVVVEDAAANKTVYNTVVGTTVGIDAEAPVPGNSGALSVTNLSTTSLTLNWQLATDNSTPQSQLSYTVYYSLSANIANVSDAQTNGTPAGTGVNISSRAVTGLQPSAVYYFTVLVSDATGNKAVYNTASATTVALDVTAPVPGNSGRLTVSSVTPTGFLLSWTKGTDNATAQTSLKYAVYKASSGTLTTVSGTKAGVFVGSGTNISSMQVSGSAGQMVYVNVVITDTANPANNAIYQMTSQQLPTGKIRGPKH